MVKTEAHVKDWKKKKVAELTKIVKENPVIGTINLESLPSSEFQIIRAHLRDDVLIKTAKKHFILEALKANKHNDLAEKVEGPTALILTKLNPFKVYKLIEKNKSLSAIKPGQEAPHDLIVPAGDTPFTPGPIIGELGQIGVKAKIVAGKISVLKDAVVVREGEPAGALAASILLRLGVKPIEVGLNLVAIKEEGTIYTPDMLSIDVESMIATAYTYAKNLVLNTGMFVSALIRELLQKAQLNALILNGVVNPEQAIKSSPAQAAPAASDKKEEEQEEEEVSEEEAAAGLGSLFG
ncbi:MAG: 50S ribosomal protein L10 [Nanoarchaeota archaeon]|nr:50S ribosomal protein L10 [Nanoarchaeota archaeon]